MINIRNYTLWLVLRNSLLFLILIMTILLANVDVFKKNVAEEIKGFISLITTENEKRKLTIINIDGVKGIPLKGSEFQIFSVESKEIKDVITTNKFGKATSVKLDNNSSYIVRQVTVKQPYIINKTDYSITLNDKENKISIKNHVPNYVKEYELDENNNVNIKELNIDVVEILQKPELPNGCEATALTCTLNHFGYNVNKVKISDNYIPKRPFIRKGEKLIGPDPNKAYGGNARSKNGFYVYAPPVIEAATKYINSVDGNHIVIDISGSEKNKIIDILNKGIPVIIWTTTDMKNPRAGMNWYLYETNKPFQSISNSHTVVLTGYNRNLVHVMDPLKGKVSYDKNEFFSVYKAAGQHALIITKSDK